MKKLILIFFIAVPAVFTACSKNESANPEDSQYVYVCTSNSAKTYHTDRNCSRLKNCGQEVLEVTRKKARENERIICSDCDKRDKKSDKDSTK
ncbi:MAG: hypothetical protein AB2L26_12245 [Ignavibacteria bacterium]